MAVSNDLKGARLEFVLKPARGPLKKRISSYDPKEKKIVHTEAVAEKGEKGAPTHYMLYLPNGNSYHLTAQQAVRRNLMREPLIIGLDGVNDNTSPAGRFKFGVNPELRMQAYAEMEQAVIKACTGRAAVSLLEETKEAA